MPEEFDIPEFVHRCINGDDDAHAEFYNRYNPYLQNVVRNRLVQLNVYYSQSDVEDLTNDIVLKISENNYEKFSTPNDPRYLNGWLFVTARNHLTSFVRNQARRDTVMKQYARETDSQEQPRALAVIQRAEDPERILNSLKTLDACERIVVTMYYVDNLKYFEIGEVLSLNINTVATIIRRAKQKLRKHLDT